MNETTDTDLYKGFDLSDYGDEEKAQAIIDFLDLDADKGDTITETGYGDSGEYYTINQRKVKRGTTPKQYVEVIQSFKALLTPKQRDLINGYLKLLGVLEWCGCGKVKDKLYHKIDAALEKHRNSKDDTIKTHWDTCSKDALHVSNILYALLWLPDHRPKTSYHSPEVDEPDHVLCYREAWFGQPVKDRRKFSTENNGVYRILTDSEADKAFEDSCDESLWRDAVSAKNGTWLGYEEWCEMVKDNDGRGSMLSSYDSSEDEVDVSGTTYYIYRTD